MSQQQFNNNDNDNAINYDHHEDYNLYGQSSQSSQQQHGENPVDLVLHRKDKKVKKDCFVWKDDLVYYMIELWKNEPILYNAKHADYFDKNKRNLALGRMWDQLSLHEFYPLPSQEQILEKNEWVADVLQRTKEKSGKLRE